MGITNVRNRAVYTKATGVITHIEETYDPANDDYDYDVTVKFNADGKEYETSLGEYSASMQEEKKIEIYYDPDDPTNIIAASKTGPIVMISLGSLGILIGVITFFRGLTGRF